ncbi:MAG: hypothetical protein ACI8Z1_003164 [Candidatus Azotimanducaceae bacterium]|jgi:hypothetical protein
MWSEPKKMDDSGIIIAAFEESGLATKGIFEGMQDSAIKQIDQCAPRR